MVNANGNSSVIYRTKSPNHFFDESNFSTTSSVASMSVVFSCTLLLEREKEAMWVLDEDTCKAGLLLLRFNAVFGGVFDLWITVGGSCLPLDVMDKVDKPRDNCLTKVWGAEDKLKDNICGKNDKWP